MKKKEIPVLSVILYIAAGITAAAATILALNIIPEIAADARAMSFGGGFGDILANLGRIVYTAFIYFFQYYIYALLLAAAGLILSHAVTVSKLARRSSK